MGLWHRLGRRTKGLSQREIHLGSGTHHSVLKRGQVSLKPASFKLATTCFPHISSSPNGFQSSLILLESYFQGEPNAVCYEGQGLLLMENIGNYRNCATWITLELFDVYLIRTYPF